MQSKNTHYIDRLDQVRFFAAAMVVFFHTSLAVKTPPALVTPTSIPKDPFLIPLIDQGHTGVQLFMVISGMILTIIAGDKEIEISKFYLNRILRIYPLFIFVVTLGYFSTPDPRATSIGIDYLMSLLPISNLYRLQYGLFGGQLWTVAVELQFYLLFPFLLTFRRKYGVGYIVGLIGFCLFLRTMLKFGLIGTVHQIAFFSIFGNLEVFLVGMLAGDLFRFLSGKRKWWYNPWVLPVYFVMINVLIYWLFKNPFFFHVDLAGASTDQVSRSRVWIVWPTIQALMWAAFVLIYIRSELPIPFSTLFTKLGKYSYSIYVWHVIILLWLQKDFPGLSPYALGLLVILPVTICVSIVSYHLIEKPFLEMRVRYTRAVEQKAAAPSLPSS